MKAAARLAKAVGEIVQAGFGLPDVVGVIEKSGDAKRAFNELRGIPSDEISMAIQRHLTDYLASGRRDLQVTNEYESAASEVAMLMSTKSVAGAAALGALERPENLAEFLSQLPEVVRARRGLRADIEPFFDDALGAVARVLVEIAPTNPEVQLIGVRETLDRLSVIVTLTSQVATQSAQTHAEILEVRHDLAAGFDALLRGTLASPEDGLRQYLWSAEQIRDTRTAHFVGRSFVFDEIEAAIQAGRSGYLLVRGEPGIGKSAVMAEFVRRRGCVYHFNVASGGIRSAQRLLLNLCAQLVLRYNLPYKSLPASAGIDSALLSTLLEEAAEKASSAGDLPVVVVVDALDEADEPRQGENRLQLPKELPAGVIVVATIRENVDDGLEVARRLATVAIRAEDPRNLDDVRAYIDAALARSAELSAKARQWAETPTGFVDLLTKSSEGNFMYLVHVLEGIGNGAITHASFGDSLPEGLTDYYRRHWRSMRSRDKGWFEHAQRPVVCLLAVSPYPLTVLKLRDWINDSGHFEPVELRQVRRVLVEWQQFLDEVPGDPPAWRLYHQSFIDFLGSADADGVDLQDFARASVAATESKVQWVDERDVDSETGSSHRPSHLPVAEKTEP